MKSIEELKSLSAFAANRIDWIQGPGGNTSVKQANNMFIKASGTTLADVVYENAVVAVNNHTVLEPLLNEQLDITDALSIVAFNKNVLNGVVAFEGTNPLLRPSMETSFHSLFYNYTLHTHNVYANLFLCSDRFDLLEKCFNGNEDYTVSLLGDYYTPGAELSWHIWNQFRFEEAMPNVLFLPNHGVIYSHSNLEKLLAIHEDVEQKLLGYLQIDINAFPKFHLIKKDDKSIIVKTDFLKGIITQDLFEKIFEELLFPDQAIYIKKEEISFTNSNAKLYINSEFDFVFNTNHKEAATMVELMIAYFYLYTTLLQKKWEPLTINYDWHKLVNMQSEQYRKSLMGN